MLNKTRLLILTLLTASATLSVTAAAQQRPYLPTNAQTQALLTRTSRDVDTFRRSVDMATRNDRTNPTRGGNEDLLGMVYELADVTAHLRDHADRRLVLDTDVEDVLNRGARIDALAQQRRIPAQAQTNWTLVRRDLDDLSRAYRVQWDWASPRYSPGPDLFYSRLTGTYQLDPVRSDNPRRIADAAAQAAANAQRPQVVQNLISRLEPPQVLAIDRQGASVTIASSDAARVTFQADGRATTEQFPNGRTVTTRATAYGDQLMVSTVGNRGSDFTVTFEPVDNGRTLRVTRRLDNDNLTQPVTARSFYRRTAEQAQWDLYPTEPMGSAGIPDGTVLITRLNTPLSSRTTPQGARFTVTVQSPGQYQGAVIDGIVLRADRTANGRNDLVFDFNSIRFRNGRNSDYTGVLSSIRTPDGSVINVDTQSVVRQSRTDEAVQRGTIGAAVGAIIGALAGGGKGAAIGAAVGATGGAGTVFIEGRDRLDLPVGSEIEIITIASRGRLTAAPVK